MFVLKVCLYVHHVCLVTAEVRRRSVALELELSCVKRLPLVQPAMSKSHGVKARPMEDNSVDQ